MAKRDRDYLEHYVNKGDVRRFPCGCALRGPIHTIRRGGGGATQVAVIDYCQAHGENDIRTIAAPAGKLVQSFLCSCSVFCESDGSAATFHRCLAHDQEPGIPEPMKPSYSWWERLRKAVGW